MSTRRGEGVPEVPVHAATQAPYATPWGEGRVCVCRGRLVEVELPPAVGTDKTGLTAPQDPHELEALQRWVHGLEAYFRGEKLCWAAEELAAELEGLSLFAQSTVRALLTVPAGETVGYGELAAMAGHPRAARAVGSIMAVNAIPVVVPCHRVIRSDGSLGRYGTDDRWKPRLLEHERAKVKVG